MIFEFVFLDESMPLPYFLNTPESGYFCQPNRVNVFAVVVGRGDYKNRFAHIFGNSPPASTTPPVN